MRLALLRAPLPGWRMALAHKAGAALDHTQWSHGELIFGDRITGSAWLDGGVQLRGMPPEHYAADIWDFFELPDHLEPAARRWFADNAGAGYDVLGPARFAIGVVRQTADRWYCHEAIAEALALPDSWRWTGGLFVSLGPQLWPGEFKRVGGPWPTRLPNEWPTELVRCTDA